MIVTDKTADGRVFGPLYPPALQHVVNHAERLWALVSIHELTPPANEWSAAWLVGRSEEIARVACDILGPWREGRQLDAEAIASLEAYLLVLHDGLARHLGCAAPACCRAPREGPLSSAATCDVTIDEGGRGLGSTLNSGVELAG